MSQESGCANGREEQAHRNISVLIPNHYWLSTTPRKHGISSKRRRHELPAPSEKSVTWKRGEMRLGLSAA